MEGEKKDWKRKKKERKEEKKTAMKETKVKWKKRGGGGREEWGVCPAQIGDKRGVYKPQGW